MIVDIHTHTFPDQLAPRALEVLIGNSQLPVFTDATCSGLAQSMGSAGIDISCVMPIATKPSQAKSINRWAVEVNSAYEQLICFGSLHPEQTDLEDEIAWLLHNHVPGIKLHPDYQNFFVDDPNTWPMYKELEEAGLIVLFHAGVDIGLPPPVHCTPDRLAKVLDAFPKLKIIAAHMGSYMMWDDVFQHLVGRDLYFDTSYSYADIGAEKMVELIEAHGAERVLFGTDSPWTDQLVEVNAIRSLDMADEKIEAVMGNNAAALLGLR